MKLQYNFIPVIISLPFTIVISILTIKEKYVDFISNPLGFLFGDIIQSLLIFSFLIPLILGFFQYWKIIIDDEKIIYKDNLLFYTTKYKMTFYWKDIIFIRIYRNGYSTDFTLNTKEGEKGFNGQMSSKQVLLLLSYFEIKNISYDYRDTINPKLSKKKSS